MSDVQIAEWPWQKQATQPLSFSSSRLKKPGLHISQRCPSTFNLHEHFPVWTSHEGGLSLLPAGWHSQGLYHKVYKEAAIGTDIHYTFLTQCTTFLLRSTATDIFTEDSCSTGNWKKCSSKSYRKTAGGTRKRNRSTMLNVLSHIEGTDSTLYIVATFIYRGESYANRSCQHNYHFFRLLHRLEKCTFCSP